MRLPNLSPSVDRRSLVASAAPLRDGVRPQNGLKCGGPCSTTGPSCPASCPSCLPNSSGVYQCATSLLPFMRG